MLFSRGHSNWAIVRAAADSRTRHLPGTFIGMVQCPRPPLSLEEIVEGGLCIGCGLCLGVAGSEKIQIVLTPEGRERPVALRALDAATLERINAICPGTRVEGTRPEAQSEPAAHDVVWGSAERLAIGYAGDPQLRHRASTG